MYWKSFKKSFLKENRLVCYKYSQPTIIMKSGTLYRFALWSHFTGWISFYRNHLPKGDSYFSSARLNSIPGSQNSDKKKTLQYCYKKIQNSSEFTNNNFRKQHNLLSTYLYNKQWSFLKLLWFFLMKDELNFSKQFFKKRKRGMILLLFWCWCWDQCLICPLVNSSVDARSPPPPTDLWWKEQKGN